MRLIDILADLGCDYEVCYVKPQAAKEQPERHLVEDSSTMSGDMSWLQHEVAGVSLKHADIKDGWIFVALGSEELVSGTGKKPKRHGLDYLNKLSNFKPIAVLVDSKDPYAMDYLRSLSLEKNENSKSPLSEDRDLSKITSAAASLKIIKVDDLTENLDVLAKAVYDYKDLPAIGVTGTNGKSSVVHTLSFMLDKMHQKTAVIGTVYTGFNPPTDEMPDTSDDQSGLTTPDIFSLYRYARDFHKQDAAYLALECSSHGLKQDRVKGLNILCGVFTNISQDHLDYHSSYEDYEMSKHKLFEMPSLKYAVINQSDPIGKKWLAKMKTEQANSTAADDSTSNPKCLSYGYTEDGKDADIFAEQITITRDGAQAMVHSRFGSGLMKTKTAANWGIYNSLAVLGVMLHLGFDFAKCLTALAQVPPLNGRMQKLSKLAADKSSADFIVDYAHSTDALRNTLISARTLVHDEGALWVIFGCGGERDKDKRAPMGKLAAQLADKIVLTNDNPRGEDPDEIIQDILQGINVKLQQNSIAADDYISVIPDRAAALDFALDNAKIEDLVVVAGKGHESYQDKGGVKTYFNDYEYIKERLR